MAKTETGWGGPGRGRLILVQPEVLLSPQYLQSKLARQLGTPLHPQVGAGRKG